MITSQKEVALDSINSQIDALKAERDARLEAINNVTTNKPTVSIGDIYVTCPGVTEQQVAEKIGGVLGKELDKQFSGFHNYTDQMSRIR